MLGRSKSQGVNLKYLKKGIDVKIQAILKYLQSQQNLSTAKVEQVMANQIELEKKATNRESLNTDIGSQANFVDLNSMFESGTSEIINKQKISLAEYLQSQRRQNKQNEEHFAKGTFTPVKNSREYASRKSSRSNSEQSSSKRNIEANANLKIFGAPLTESFNTVNLPSSSPNLFTIKIQHIDPVRQSSNHSTSRSMKSKKNKQNIGTETPSISKQKNTAYLRRTPHSSHYSATKRLYEYFSGHDRPFKPIAQQTLKQMQEEIEQLYKHTRKQGQDNNVRARLLKRIEGSKLKADQFMGPK